MKNRSLKSIVLVSGLIAGFYVSAFAASTSPNQTAAPAGAGGAAASGGAQTRAQITDVEILDMVNAVDQHEIEAASMAMKKKPSSEVRNYAKMLKEQHTANLSKTRKLAKKLDVMPKPGQTSEEFRAKGADEMKTLASKNGIVFEKAYVEAMVNGHTEVLQMLDTMLIPSAQNGDVKSHLTEVRGHVAEHLEQGKRLQEVSASKATD